MDRAYIDSWRIAIETHLPTQAASFERAMQAGGAWGSGAPAPHSGCPVRADINGPAVADCSRISVEGRSLLGAEPFRAAMELARHKLAKSGTTKFKPGDGHAVVIFPGLGANGSSVSMLREHCRSLGYQAFDWGQGFNTGPEGDLATWLEVLESQVTGLLMGQEQPATLIGWSRGGIYARELGKLMAPRPRQVIMIGTSAWLARRPHRRTTALRSDDAGC